MAEQELQKMERADLQVPATESMAVLNMIERASRDPSVDMDKFERLMAMQERLMANKARTEFNQALAEMQPYLPVVEKRGRIVIRDKNNQEKVIQSTPYGLWEDINEAIRPVLGEHGFSLTFRNGATPEGKITVTAILGHKAGHSVETTIPLPHDSTGSKNAIQAIGSSTSYGKRITACTILNITVGGEDDDATSCGDFIDEKQAADIRKRMAEASASEEQFLRWLSNEAGCTIAEIEKIPADKYQSSVDKLDARRKALAAQKSHEQTLREQLQASVEAENKKAANK